MKTPAALVAWALLGWLAASVQGFWMEDVAHQGYAPYAESGYEVFRNVRDYGARGDGVTDDTAAINAAIASGGRCGVGCNSSTATPAVVYFPAGTYVISAPVVPFYLTQLIGDAGAPATLKAAAGFAGMGLIDGNPYGASGELNWLATNVFFRQVRNLVLDTTAVAAATAIHGMHWPTAQATSLQNVRFVMPTAPGVAHVGLFVESGSGGFMADLAFVGGAVGASLGNQQFTMRNLTFDSCVTAIGQLWDWGWTYAGLRVRNCVTGINVTAGGPDAQAVGSITVLDSAFDGVPVAVASAHTAAGRPATGGSIVLENVHVTNGEVVVQTPDGNVLPCGADGRAVVEAWAIGHAYEAPGGEQQQLQGAAIAPPARPAGLLASSYGADDGAVPGAYYSRSKPQYADLPASQFLSARAAGARGDGRTDDTAALQAAMDAAARAGRVLYLDYGLYLVTATLTVPPGARIVGEAYPVLLAGGGGRGSSGGLGCGCGSGFFGSAEHPRPLLRVGEFAGQPGTVELSDFVLGTQGAQPGAVLLEWNLDAQASAAAATAAAAPAGLWDVHTRIGGFLGSGLQAAQCVKAPAEAAVDPACIGAFMSMHVTAGAGGLYAENVWLWTADHDMDDGQNTQITVYSGRGLYIEAASNVWLVGTAAEHHALYQYQLDGAAAVFVGQVQTETPYYQPNPAGAAPFAANASYADPDLAAAGGMAWGLRALGTADLLVYGAGLYSFFDNYEQTCIPNRTCQAQILSVEHPAGPVRVYNLNTIGVQTMATWDGQAVAASEDNLNSFADTIAVLG